MPSPTTPSPGHPPFAPDYQERLLPSAAFWLMAPAAAVVLWFAVSALHQTIGVLIAVAGAAVVLVLLWRSSPVILVGDDASGRRWLQAGNARIEVDFLGAPQPLDVEAMRLAMGPQLRADAHVFHRPWVHTGVRLDITDPRDPTPYWLVATRQPEQLATALGPPN